MSVLDDLTLDELLAYPDPTPVSARRPRKLTLAEMRASLNSANTSDKVLAPQRGVSAYAHQATTSDNPSFQGKGRATDACTLWTFAAKATQARTSGRQQRRALRFPSLRTVYAKERRDLNGSVSRKGKSYRGDIWTYLTAWGYRVLNDLDGAGYAPPSHEALTDLFERRVRERGVTFFSPYSTRGHGIGLPDVETLADHAATAVLRDWSPDWILEMRRRGAKGGRTSKRPPSWTDDDLDALTALDGLTVDEQARTLGCSPSTVDRMRRALRQRQG